MKDNFPRKIARGPQAFVPQVKETSSIRNKLLTTSIDRITFNEGSQEALRRSSNMKAAKSISDHTVETPMKKDNFQ